MAKNNANKQGVPKQGIYKHVCGTPKEFCGGSNTNVNHGLGGVIKTHNSPEDAFVCYKRYLIKQGYTATGSQTFAAPNGGPVLILTKKGRFGAKLRTGKEATRNMSMKHCGVIF